MNFTVYRSSAGSGKTFTLVKEYLKIALVDEAASPLKFRKILAITFTNKAAQEMKDRVIRALKELSDSSAEPGDLAKILIEELGLDKATLAVRSENLLRAILHHYSDFAIGTIDAFTHRIVRSFAYDLGLPVNFEIETEKDELLQKAVDKLMSMIGTDEGITNTLIRFSEEKTDAEKGWQIENELKSTAGFLLQESGTIFAERLRDLSLKDFTEIRSRLYVLTTDFENRITLLSGKALDLIRSNGLTEADFARGNSGIAAWFRRINGCDYERLTKPNSYVLKTIQEDSWISGESKKNGNAPKVTEIAPSLRELYEQITGFATTNQPEYITRNAIQKHLYSLAVLNELEKILRSFREEDNVVHISEFNHIISKVVIDQPVPYIFEKLGARYSHFLVDEFQDTSVLQWENLLPLLENGLAENNFSMVVGDAKQAIYRWRSGDVEQFVSLPQLINKGDNVLMRDREQSLIRHYREEELAKNFRSKKIVVEFNNALFLKLSALLSDQYNRIYQRVSQETKPGNDGGYVEVRLPVREGSREEIYSSYTREAVSLVKELLLQGWDKNEIALLVRENRQGSLLADALIAEKIPVLSSDSLLIRNSPLICCIVSLLRALEYPEDKITLADVAVYLNKTNRGYYPLHNIRLNNVRLSELLQVYGIREDLSFISVLPLYQQCESIVRIVFPDEQQNAWVVFFLDELLRFGASRNPDRQSFFGWWEERSGNASVVIPEGTDAVNIMTIHKSKGLEFPVVILPYLDWKKKSGAKEMWVELDDAELPQLEVGIVTENAGLCDSSVKDQFNRETDKKVLDQLNVLYVACTRAVDQLYILSEKGKDEANDPTNVVAWFNRTLSNETDENGVVKSGEPVRPVRKVAKQPATALMPLSAGESKWTGRIRVRRYSEDTWNTKESARERGVLIHHLLQKIRFSEDIDKEISAAINAGWLASHDKDEIARQLQNVVAHDTLREYFNGDIRTYSEADILIPGEGASRPDRVIVRGDEAVVLEYKSGAESGDHLHQVRHYKSLLERMGYQKISGKLIYLDPLKVIDV